MPLSNARGDPGRAGLLKETLHRADPAFGPSRVETGPALLHARLARPRALAALFSALSATALLLAAIGLFSVLSAYLRERRREIGVRSALGATPSRLRSLVVAQTLGVAAAGVACGIPLALGSSDLLSKLVTDVQPPNVATVITVAVVLLFVVAAATIGPMVTCITRRCAYRARGGVEAVTKSAAHALIRPAASRMLGAGAATHSDMGNSEV